MTLTGTGVSPVHHSEADGALAGGCIYSQPLVVGEGRLGKEDEDWNGREGRGEIQNMHG